MKAYFEEIWALESNKAVAPDPKEPSAEYLREHLKMLWEQYGALLDEIDWGAETIKTNSVTLLHGSSAPENKAPALWQTLFNYMKCVEDSIVIQTSYVICDKTMYSDLSTICGSAETVQIVTNAAENGANPWGCSDYLSQRDNILAAGVRLC